MHITSNQESNEIFHNEYLLETCWLKVEYTGLIIFVERTEKRKLW